MNLHEMFTETGLTEFMILISVSGISMLLILIRSLSRVVKGKKIKKRDLNLILFLGSLSLIIGITVQIVGLFGAFEAIKVAGYVTAELLSLGLSISIITPIYGLIYLLISLGAWRFLRKKIE